MNFKFVTSYHVFKGFILTIHPLHTTSCYSITPPMLAPSTQCWRLYVNPHQSIQPPLPLQKTQPLAILPHCHIILTKHTRYYLYVGAHLHPFSTMAVTNWPPHSWPPPSTSIDRHLYHIPIATPYRMHGLPPPTIYRRRSTIADITIAISTHAGTSLSLSKHGRRSIIQETWPHG